MIKYNVLYVDWGDLGYHPDHQTSGQLALEARFVAGVGRAYPTAGPKWDTPQFYMWEYENPGYYFGLSDELLQVRNSF